MGIELLMGVFIKPLTASKTAKGKRLIQIGESIFEVLRQHYEKQKQFCHSLNLEISGEFVVFKEEA